MIFSISGYCGVNIVLTLVKSFGALIAVTGIVLFFRQKVVLNGMEVKIK